MNFGLAGELLLDEIGRGTLDVGTDQPHVKLRRLLIIQREEPIGSKVVVN